MTQLPFLPWLVAFMLCVPALLFVLYPFYRPYHHLPASAQDVGGSRGESGDRAGFQLENELAARSALKEIELDYQLGNLAELDYRSLRESYMRRAFTAHKSIQAHEQQLDELIEERLRQMRSEQEAHGVDRHDVRMGNDDKT